MQIQVGNAALYNELWQNCHKLLFYILSRYKKRIELPNYISTEDLEQCMYEALRAAVSSYDSGKPYKFNTYLQYNVMKVVQAQLPDNRIKETSANQNFSEDETDGAELLDFITDDTVTERFKDIELQELRKKVCRAVAELPADSRMCIELCFLKGIPQRQAAELMNLTTSRVRGAIDRGLRIMRKNRLLYELYQ